MRKKRRLEAQKVQKRLLESGCFASTLFFSRHTYSLELDIIPLTNSTLRAILPLDISLSRSIRPFVRIQANSGVFAADAHMSCANANMRI